MSSLLKKIQKPPARINDLVSDILLDSSQASKRDEVSDGDFKLIKSSGSISARNDLNSENAQELWTASEQTFPREVERLVGDLIRIADNLVPEDHEVPVDPEAVFATALERAQRGLAAEFSFARYDISLVKNYFRGLSEGFGPLQVLTEDSGVTEIYVDAHDRISVRKGSRLIKTGLIFRSRTEYLLFLRFMARRAVKTPASNSSHSVFVIHGERVVLCSVSGDTLFSYQDPKLCLRIPRPAQVSFYDLLRTRFVPAILASWLTDVSATAAKNILIVGPKQSGKTALASCLLNSAPSHERIVTVEELPEIMIANPQFEKLLFENGYASEEAAELLHFALQRAPHRIGLDAIRGSEAGAFLGVMEQGTSGCVTTIQADSVEDGLWKFADLVMMAEFSSEESVVRRISRSVSLVLKTGIENEMPILEEVIEILPPRRGQFNFEKLVGFEGRVDGTREWGVETTNSPLQEQLKKDHNLELVPGV